MRHDLHVPSCLPLLAPQMFGFCSAMASGDPVLWAAQRQAKIAAARALREQHRDGLTEQHTFHPKCLPRRPASGPPAEREQREQREARENQSRPSQKAHGLLPRRVARARASSRGASPGLSRLPDTEGAQGIEGPRRLPESTKTEGSGGYVTHGNVLAKPPKSRVRGASPSPIARRAILQSSSPRSPLALAPLRSESRRKPSEVPSETMKGGTPAEDSESEDLPPDLSVPLLGTSRFIDYSEATPAHVQERCLCF